MKRAPEEYNGKTEKCPECGNECPIVASAATDSLLRSLLLMHARAHRLQYAGRVPYVQEVGKFFNGCESLVGTPLACCKMLANRPPCKKRAKRFPIHGLQAAKVASDTQQAEVRHPGLGPVSVWSASCI